MAEKPNTDSQPMGTKVDGPKPTGSPVTAGTKQEDVGKGGVKATEGNLSKDTVEGKPGTDNSPGTPPGDHANIAGPTQDPKNPAVVKPEDVAGKKEEIATPAEIKSAEEEFARAKAEPETPVPTDAELDEADKKQGYTAGIDDDAKNAEDTRPVDQHAVNEALERISNIVLDLVSRDTPDSFSVWGVQGGSIKLGDLRAIARNHRKTASK